MCGIIAVLRRRRRRQPPSKDQVLECLDQVRRATDELNEDPRRAVGEAKDALAEAGRLLAGAPGVICLYRNQDLIAAIEDAASKLDAEIGELEERLDAGQFLATDELESLNARLIELKDLAWSVSRDCVNTARSVADLGGADLTDDGIENYASIAMALSALDRLEVRGRDSAGLHVSVTGPEIPREEQLEKSLGQRLANRLFTNCAVRESDGQLCFVYKAAAEIGELGDNGQALRESIREDDLLRLALDHDEAEAVVLGHTRWASVGIISQANAHPVNQEEDGPTSGPYVAAVLNGDVDNFIELRDTERLRIAPEITTDTKVIPTLVSRRLGEGTELNEAFRQTTSSFVGSVAIGCYTTQAPDRLLLALRGSGQGIFVGMGEDFFIAASEPYGVVEASSSYLRLDGESAGNTDNPSASQGQILVLSREAAGELEGIERIAYDGTPLPVRDEEFQQAEVTTRDINRGEHRHYLIKEITEAPLSFNKTLRGKIDEDGGKLHVVLGDETLPAGIRDKLSRNEFGQLRVIGQGTAAVAGQGVAAAMKDALAQTGIQVDALPATELSGFELQDDMSDTLIVAISQSGTTTDTNRTVDLVRSRGAAVIAIVNRRGSDLTEKADGVLYTSDGRDIEMSVASTKAFYSQIAAGFLLAAAIRQEVGPADEGSRNEILAALRALPSAMQQVLAKQDEIRKVARRQATKRRYWAVVGNGVNRVAAEEIRIKLSELCYKSIACDATEDKKHIDLSAEPMILVCAAGLSGSTASDVAKELAIYRAHKAAPILITGDDRANYPADIEFIRTPEVHPTLDFVLSTMVGHLFGYHAALAIDELAHPLRLIRAAIENLVAVAAETDDLLGELDSLTRPHIATFYTDMAEGQYDGQLEASTAVRLASHLGYVNGTKPLDSYEQETNTVGTPALVIENLTEALTKAIEELTRPVDAIKHQAKTVTVGISRTDESLVTVPLVKAVLGAGAPRDRISYRCLKGLGALDAAVAEVTGSTRYEITGDGRLDKSKISVVRSTGIAEGIPSRTANNPQLRGTKHLVAAEQELLISRGRSDNRTVILIPEVRSGRSTGLTLLHVNLHEHANAATMHGVLAGYRNRYSALRDLVTETEPSFDEERLAQIPVVELLTSPVHVLADRWKH